MKRRQPIAILDKVLPPADEIESRLGTSTSTRSFRSSWYLMIARASNVFPRPTLSAMMQPPKRSSLSMAPTTPSR